MQLQTRRFGNDSADGEKQSVENRQDRYPRLRDWGNNFSDRPVPRFKQGLEADKSRFSLQKYQKADREEGPSALKALLNDGVLARKRANKVAVLCVSIPRDGGKGSAGFVTDLRWLSQRRSQGRPTSRASACPQS